MFIKRALKYFPLRYRSFMKRGDVSLNQIRYLYSKNILTDYTLHSVEKGVSSEEYVKGQQIVVSLTTYGKRLHEVYIAIESIMQQTTKPNRIILWLEEGLKDLSLPMTLQRQIKRGLEVKYCKNIRSYKKLIPTLKICPNDAIITIDDDIIYRFDVLENLINAYIDDSHYIYCTRMHRIKTKSNSTSPLPYSNWDWCVDDGVVSPLNFPTGGGGTLYPPPSLSKEVLNEDVFMRICPFADDVWFKAMALLNNYQDRKVVTQEDSLLFSEDNQDIALSVDNVVNGGNDKQIRAVFDRYNLYEKLRE